MAAAPNGVTSGVPFPESLNPGVVAEYVSDGIVVLDAEWQIVYLNSQAQKTAAHFLSLLATEGAGQISTNWFSSLIGRSVLEIFPEGVDSAFFRSCQRVMQTDETAKFEEPCRGRQSWFEGTICKHSGGIAIFFRNITERKSAQESERRLRRELKAIASCNQILISAEDEQTLLNDICRIICDQAGYRMAWVGYAQNDDIKSVLPVAWAGFEAGYLNHAQISWADNERGHGPTGSAIRTEEKTHCADFTSDPKVSPWREAALRRGYLASLVLPLKSEEGRTFGALSIYASETNPFSPDEVRILEQLAADLAFGITVLRARAARKRADESLELEKEAAQLLLVQARDSAEQARAAAIEANAAKSTFLANMSHEIRTPLAAVLGFAELIASTDLNKGEQEKYLAAINRNGRLLSSIINDLMDLSKVETGMLEINLQPVAIRDVLNDLEVLLNPQALKKGIALHIRAESDVPSAIRTDPVRLQQILLNIGGNAIKFTQKGSVIVSLKRLIPLKDRRSGIAIQITDTGTGLSQIDAAKLFLPFSQADSSFKREFGGPGLGLALARRLAELLGGNVMLTESTPGVGSTFTITLNNCILDQSPNLGTRTIEWAKTSAIAPTPSAASSVALKSSLNGTKVLLVEDSPDIQVLISRYLKMSGAEVEIADNGQKALELTKKNQYDLILMDIQMPVMDGFEAVHALRRQGFDRPIVALTAHALVEERQRCLESGFTEHLGKPIRRETLVETLVDTLNDSRAKFSS